MISLFPAPKAKSRLLIYTLHIFILCHIASCGHSDDNALPYVVVIGIDGMSPAGLRQAKTPYIDSLIKKGSHTMKARCVRPTSSSSNWASMISGAGVEQHGVTSNDWERDHFDIHPAVIGQEEIFPTMFSVFREHLPNERSAAYYHWKGMGRLMELTTIDYVFQADSERITTEEFAQNIILNKPRLNFLSLDHVDGAGHQYGHLSEGYLQAIEYTDSLVGIVINAIKEAGILDKTVIFILSDHGFKGFGHGGDSMDELLIPFVISGKGIKQDYEISQPVYIYDLAASVLTLFNVEIPHAWIGKPVNCAFDKYTCEHKINLGSMKIDPPIINPNFGGFRGVGGLFLDEIKVTAKPVTQLPIYYTLDGSEPHLGSKTIDSSGIVINKSSVFKAAHIDEDGTVGRISEGQFRLIASSEKPKLELSYYELERIRYMPNFKLIKPIKTAKVYEIYPDTGIISRVQNIAMVYKAKLIIPEGGKYKFYLSSDDGSLLYINGQMVVDNDGCHGMKEKSGSIELYKGVADVRLEYFNGEGKGWFELHWSGPGMHKQFIFPEYLSN